LRLDGIVPLSMKGISEEVESSKFLVGDFKTGGISMCAGYIRYPTSNLIVYLIYY